MLGWRHEAMRKAIPGVADWEHGTRKCQINVRDAVQLLSGEDGVNSLELAQASWRDFGRTAHPKMQRTLTNDLTEENWNVGVQQPASESSKRTGQRDAQTRDQAQVDGQLRYQRHRS